MGKIFGGARILFAGGHHWRIVDISGDVATLTDMDSTKLIEAKWSVSQLEALVNVGRVEVCEDQMLFAAPDESEMTDLQKESYRKKCAFITSVIQKCGEPLFSRTYTDIKGNAREVFLACAEDAGLIPKIAWQTWRVYRQSGMQRSSLADKRRYATRKPATYKLKNGRPSAVAQGKILTKEDLDHIDEFLEELKRGYSELDAYASMLDKYYSVTVGGNPDPVPESSVLDMVSCEKKVADLDEIERELYSVKREWLPADQRPTIDQFKYRKRKRHLSEEIKKARMGENEYENNCRRLRDSPRRKLRNIGEVAEVDHCELDVYAVSEIDPTAGIGKPVLHAMIDTATGVIQAFSVSLNNNSCGAVTRLMINAFEDKVAWAAKYNIYLKDMDSLDKTLFPTFIPRVIRADRGSDFKSDKFLRFCSENDIDLQLVPGARGSYKPNIERLFKSFHQSIENSLEGRGLINRSYRDRGKSEAMLTLADLTRVCIVFVLHYNQHIMEEKNKTVQQMVDGEFETSPIGFFRYMLKHGDVPRTVLETQRDDLIYSLLDPMTVTIHRDGLHYKGLVFDEPVDDPELTLKIQNATGNETMEVRRDPFDTSRLRYIKDGTYKEATQNPGRSIGFGTLSGITWDAFEDYKACESKRNAEEREKKLRRRADARADLDYVVNLASKPMLASEKNLRENRAIEQQNDNAKHGVIDSLSNKSEKAVQPSALNPDHDKEVLPAITAEEYIKRIAEDPDAALLEADKNAHK